MPLSNIKEVQAMQLPIQKLRPFENHPFQVKDDDEMNQLVWSVLTQGVLTPLVVRPLENDEYEVISGHRRLHACQKAGIETVPALIYALDRDAAAIALVDSNLHREKILPSEKAFAYKMKMDAMRRQGARVDIDATCGNDCHKSGTKTADIVGDTVGLKGRQVRNYVRLTYLIPEILEMVDLGKIQFVPAVDLSYLDEQIQKWVCEYIKDNGFIKPVQISALKNYPNLSKANQFSVISIMNDALPKKSSSAKVSLSEKKLDKYFPPHFSAKERENVIIQLLEQWSAEQKQAE